MKGPYSIYSIDDSICKVSALYFREFCFYRDSVSDRWEGKFFCSELWDNVVIEHAVYGTVLIHLSNARWGLRRNMRGIRDSIYQSAQKLL